MGSINAGETGTAASPFEFTVSDDLEPATLLAFEITVASGEIAQTLNVSMISGPLYRCYSNDFEDVSDEDWTHELIERKDLWARGRSTEEDNILDDAPSPHSGDNMWGTGLHYSGSYMINSEMVLKSPVFDCTGQNRVFLTFWRWLTVEKSEFDQAAILVNDVKIWENDYYVHHIDRKWTQCFYDITSYVQSDPMIRITFSLDTDEGLNLGGWCIDDLAVVSGVDNDFYNRFTEPCTVKIATSQETYAAGDTFDLSMTTDMYGNGISVVEYIALDVYETYFFWPSWGSTIDNRTQTFETRTSSRETILYFEWPEVTGHAGGIRFWAALMDATSGTLLDYDMTEWGW